MRLVRGDTFLDELGVTSGTGGRVVALSALTPQDDGVVVDWGDGKGVRMDRDEIEPVRGVAPAGRIGAPAMWRWVLGVHFLGRPVGWSPERYRAWLVQEAQR